MTRSRARVAAPLLARVAAPLLALVAGLAGSPAQAFDRDCGDFASQRAARLFFLDNGGPRSDPHAWGMC